MKTDVFKLDGSKAGTVDLPASIFGVEVRKDLLSRAVNWQRNEKRAGTASTKHRGDLLGITTKKLYRQKGTGGARHGSKRANIFRGGGVTFGPKPRSFATDLPKKVRALALKVALSAKAERKNVVVLDEAKAKTHKTKDLNAQLAKLEAQNALFIVDALDENFDRASRNIPHVKVIPTEGANVLDVLRAEKLVVTRAAVPMLEARLNSRHAGEASEAPKAEKKAPAKKAAPKKEAAAKKAPAKKAPAKKAAPKKSTKKEG